MTMAVANSHIATGPPRLPRSTSASMENCVDLMPTGANAVSYNCEMRRDALRRLPQVQMPGGIGVENGLGFLRVIMGICPYYRASGVIGEMVRNPLGGLRQ